MVTHNKMARKRQHKSQGHVSKFYHLNLDCLFPKIKQDNENHNILKSTFETRSESFIITNLRRKRSYLQNPYLGLIEDKHRNDTKHSNSPRNVNFKMSRNFRIVGGVQTDIAQYPFQVSIRTKSNVHFCGGSIIDNNHVLTARHCTFKGSSEPWRSEQLYKTTELDIWAGGRIYERAVPEDSTWRKWPVRFIFPHDRDDIAVIRIDGHFSEANSPNIQPISLDNGSGTLSKFCVVSGWGLLKDNDKALSTVLQTAVVKFIDFNYCKKAYEKIMTVTSVMLCARSDTGADTCRGDSGGPLVCNNMLTGVVSSGYGCGQSKYPGIYTKVYVFNDWIKERTLSSIATLPLANIVLMKLLIIHVLKIVHKILS